MNGLKYCLITKTGTVSLKKNDDTKLVYLADFNKLINIQNDPKNFFDFLIF